MADHSENIGLFWYIFVELFKQHVAFYQVLYMVFFGMIALQVYFIMDLYTSAFMKIRPYKVMSESVLTQEKSERVEKNIPRLAIMLALYVSISSSLMHFVGPRHSSPLSYLVRFEPLAVRAHLGPLPPLPQLCRGAIDHNLRPCLLPAEHALHVDHLGRSLLRQRQLLLLPNHRLPTVSRHALHPAFQRS